MDIKTILEADARWSQRLSIAEKPGLMRSIAVFLAHSGDSWFIAAALVLIYWLGDSFWKEWSVKYLAAIIAMALIVMALKLLIRRQRPEGEWGALYRNTDPHSFPSGHAARMALLATVTIFWGPGSLIPIVLVWAPLVALARVSMGVHYVSDILAGIVLGIVGGIIGPFLYR